MTLRQARLLRQDRRDGVFVGWLVAIAAAELALYGCLRVVEWLF